MDSAPQSAGGIRARRLAPRPFCGPRPSWALNASSCHLSFTGLLFRHVPDQTRRIERTADQSGRSVLGYIPRVGKLCDWPGSVYAPEGSGAERTAPSGSTCSSPLPPSCPREARGMSVPAPNVEVVNQRMSSLDLIADEAGSERRYFEPRGSPSNDHRPAARQTHHVGRDDQGSGVVRRVGAEVRPPTDMGTNWRSWGRAARPSLSLSAATSQGD